MQCSSWPSSATPFSAHCISTHSEFLQHEPMSTTSSSTAARGTRCLMSSTSRHGIYRQWVEALGFVANSKTGIWSRHGGHLAAQAYSGQFGYAIVSEVRDLGVDLCLRGAGRRPTHTTRMKQAFAKCLRLQRASGFSQVQLQLGVRLIILGKALWASELCPPSWHTMTELGQQVAKAIYKTLMGRNVELALGILATTPGLIPHHLHCMRTIAFWHRWLLSPRVPRALLEDAWQVGLIRSYQGRSQKTLVGILWNVADELQWRLQTLTTWVDHNGVEFDPTTCTAKQLQHRVREALRQQVCRRIAEVRSDYASLTSVDGHLLRGALQRLHGQTHSLVTFHLAGGNMSVEQYCRHKNV